MPPVEHRTFFLAEEDFLTQDTAIINPIDSHHLCNVLRLSKGDFIVVSTMEGKFNAVICSSSSLGVKIQLLECIKPLPSSLLEILMIQALPKIKKMDEIVEKATEFGVSSIHPVLTHRSPVQLSSPSLIGKEERWNRIAMAASKQSRRFKLPVITAPQRLNSFIDSDVFSNEAVKILLWENEQIRHLLSMTAPVKETMKAVVCVGPEGGFTLEEVDYLISRGFISCTLGGQILRTETAGPFSIGLLMSAMYE